MHARIFVLGACLALVVSTASAHGPQIQVTNDNNKIVTRQIILDGPYANSLTAQKLVYVIPILQPVTGSPSTSYWSVLPNSAIDPILGVTEYQFGPGLAYGYGHTFDAGQHFNVNFADSLKRWNGSTFADNPGPEEIGAFRGDATGPADTAFTTDSAPFQGLVFSDISATYNADSHSSMRFRVLGNGTSALVEPNDGIYLLRLQIASTQAGLDPTDVFSFVLYKNATPTDIATAVSSLEVDPALVQYLPIPEPAAGILAMFGVITFLMARPISRRNLA